MELAGSQISFTLLSVEIVWCNFRLASGLPTPPLVKVKEPLSIPCQKYIKHQLHVRMSHCGPCLPVQILACH